MTRQFSVAVDLAHGGRWTSLVSPSGRQWLWSQADAARHAVRPGDAFVDVGGVEECWPTIGGRPDHGDVWSRPWTGIGDRHVVETPEASLYRRMVVGSTITVDYRLLAPPGTRFIWALHALLMPDEGTRVVAPPGHPVRAWPGHVRLESTYWPHVLGIPDWNVLGPDDGTAMFSLLPALDALSVRTGPDVLTFRLTCPDQPVSFGVWRNLGGYPWDGTPAYRNFGVEPMLGRVFDLSAAGPDDAAVVPSSGSVEWQLVIDDDGDRGHLEEQS